MSSHLIWTLHLLFGTFVTCRFHHLTFYRWNERWKKSWQIVVVSCQKQLRLWRFCKSNLPLFRASWWSSSLHLTLHILRSVVSIIQSPQWPCKTAWMEVSAYQMLRWYWRGVSLRVWVLVCLLCVSLCLSVLCVRPQLCSTWSRWGSVWWPSRASRPNCTWRWTTKASSTPR